MREHGELFQNWWKGMDDVPGRGVQEHEGADGGGTGRRCARRDRPGDARGRGVRHRSRMLTVSRKDGRGTSPASLVTGCGSFVVALPAVISVLVVSTPRQPRWPCPTTLIRPDGAFPAPASDPAGRQPPSSYSDRAADQLPHHNLLARPAYYFLSVALTVAVYSSAPRPTARTEFTGAFQFQPSGALKSATVLFLPAQQLARAAVEDRQNTHRADAWKFWTWRSSRPPSGKSGAGTWPF